jgi:hypothetical protein
MDRVMKKTDLPPVFCWTRYGVEAGEPVDEISPVRRPNVVLAMAASSRASAIMWDARSADPAYSTCAMRRVQTTVFAA